MRIVRSTIEEADSLRRSRSIVIEPEDILIFGTDYVNNPPTLYKGQRLTARNCSVLLGASLFHGSSAVFDRFHSKNIFMTQDAPAACGFASLGEYFRGNKTPEGGLRLMSCELLTKDNNKILVADSQKHPEIFTKTMGPEDRACQAFLTEHPEYEIIWFSNRYEKKFDDAGVKDVWFTNDPSKVKITAIRRIFSFADRKPRGVTWPKRIRHEQSSPSLTNFVVEE